MLFSSEVSLTSIEQLLHIDWNRVYKTGLFCYGTYNYHEERGFGFKQVPQCSLKKKTCLFLPPVKVIKGDRLMFDAMTFENLQWNLRDIHAIDLMTVHEFISQVPYLLI